MRVQAVIAEMTGRRIHFGPCKVEGCDRPVKGLGYCNKHYQRFKLDMPLITEKEQFILDNPPTDTIGLIPLTRGTHAVVDRHNYERLSRFNWNCSGDGYAVRMSYSNGWGRTILMHRVILGCQGEAEEGDHKDGNRLNNLESNLRRSVEYQNARNRKKSAAIEGKTTTSRFKGVTWHKRCKRWEVSIHWHGKSRYIGQYRDEEDAGLAYDVAAQILYGEFARLNNI